jgi:hypothetical protein
MNDDLFRSILSMDSYNRGDDGLDLEDSNLGEAIVGAFARNTGTDFFAQSYMWNGQKVISYRGTDFVNDLPAPNDVFAGWLDGAGLVIGQLQNAVEFYHLVTGGTLTSGEESDAILVGHSLAAGLPGLSVTPRVPKLTQLTLCPSGRPHPLGTISHFVLCRRKTMFEASMLMGRP